MKASLKLREEQKPPLLRLKVPLNILGLPFQSGLSACGDTKDLSLNLTTFFESGPSFKLVYKPNDSWSPFSLVVKTGIGPFGSPISAPLSMSAEFNLLSRGANNPAFFLRFSPRFGDFGVKKSAGSQSIIKSFEKSDGLEKLVVNGSGNGGISAVRNAFDGVEMSARTVLPIRNKAVLKFNWGVKFPEEVKSGDVIDLAGVGNGNNTVFGGGTGASFSKIPFLVMNKISIEHVVGEDSKKKRVADVEKEAEEVCFGVKRQLDVLHAENGLLRRAVEDLRSEFGVGKLGLDVGNVDSGKHIRGSRNCERKAVDGDVNEEAKKGSTGI